MKTPRATPRLQSCGAPRSLTGRVTARTLMFPSVVEELIERWENVDRVLRGLDAHARAKHWDMRNVLYRNECGTVGCALGHCLLDPWFQSQGMGATFNGFGFDRPDSYHVNVFFGLEGANRIFWNGDPRSVETVLREVAQHLRWLRNHL